MLINLFVSPLTLRDMTFIEFSNWSSGYFVANMNFLAAKVNQIS